MRGTISPEKKIDERMDVLKINLAKWKSTTSGFKKKHYFDGISIGEISVM